MAAANSSVSSSNVPYLKWQQRPESVQYSIERTFDHLQRQIKSGWGLFNGSSSYGTCHIDEHKLAKTLIQTAPTTQKEFYFLDIGAGEFEWGQSLAKYLNEQKDLPFDIRMHIVNVRGESYLGNRVVTLERCIVYNLGGFKVENITSELIREGFAIKNKVDLAITNWCFRHLVDPLGTLVQTHDLLRPGSGAFLFDGFFFSEENDDSVNSADPYRRLTQLMLDTKTRYLTTYNNGTRCLNHFVIQRTSDEPCRLPLSYVGTRYLGDNYQVGSQTMTHFKREGNREVNIKYPLNSEDSNFLYGDKSLYDWLKSKEVLSVPYATHKSVCKDEIIDLPFHLAILEGDEEKIAYYIEQGDLLDVSDLDGDTPLHYSVLMQNRDFCQNLLTKGANTRLANGKGHTCLHHAAIYDKEGSLLKMLLSHGVNIDARSAKYKTPLDIAIEVKNPIAVAILLENGALPSDSSLKTLTTESCFTFHPTINAFIQEFPKGFYEVLSKIEDGHCVVLQKDNNTKIMFLQNCPFQDSSYERFLTIKLPPQTDLSPQGPWLKFLSQKGCNPIMYNETKEKALRHKEIDLSKN